MRLLYLCATTNVLKTYQVSWLDLETEVSLENGSQMRVPLLGLHAQVVPDEIVDHLLQKKITF